MITLNLTEKQVMVIFWLNSVILDVVQPGGRLHDTPHTIAYLAMAKDLMDVQEQIAVGVAAQDAVSAFRDLLMGQDKGKEKEE